MYRIKKIGITCAIMLVVLAHHSVLQEDRGSADLREPHSPTDTHISVLSWNVNRGMPRARKTVQAIKNINADMVFLQETHERWEEGLRPALRNQYEYVKFLHDRGARGQAIFSRYPFREVDRVNTRSGWFPTWINQFKTPIGIIQVASVHLRPPLDEEGGVTASSLSEAPDIRQEEVRALAGRIGQAPTLVVGDFNEEIDGDAVSWIRKELNLTSAVSEFDRSTDTWKWTLKFGITLSRRFDHLLYPTNELYCPKAGVISVNYSDHRPIYGVFQKKNEE